MWLFNVESVEQIDRVTAVSIASSSAFRLTDYYSHPFEARFSARPIRATNSLAFNQDRTRPPCITSSMEVFSFDDMGRGTTSRSAATRWRPRSAATPSDFITSFYSFTPSGFMVEYGWGARSIDPDTWQAFERRKARACGGHDRKWLSAEDQAAARKLRLANAEQGMRRPVQVMEGNYQVMAGVCPYWDSVTAG
jgi:hypothetical protein